VRERAWCMRRTSTSLSRIGLVAPAMYAPSTCGGVRGAGSSARRVSVPGLRRSCDRRGHDGQRRVRDGERPPAQHPASTSRSKGQVPADDPCARASLRSRCRRRQRKTRRRGLARDSCSGAQRSLAALLKRAAGRRVGQSGLVLRNSGVHPINRYGTYAIMPSRPGSVAPWKRDRRRRGARWERIWAWLRDTTPCRSSTCATSATPPGRSSS
jgi:hypothetical protein